MDGAAARHEAEKVLAELPNWISDVIKPFARQSLDHPALVQGDITWTYAELGRSSRTRRSSSSPTIFVSATGS
jgi:hypothetical protein